MNDFFQSKFIADLKDGNLPPVKVEVETTSIVLLAGSILLVGVILIVGNAMLRK